MPSALESPRSGSILGSFTLTPMHDPPTIMHELIHVHVHVGVNLSRLRQGFCTLMLFIISVLLTVPLELVHVGSMTHNAVRLSAGKVGVQILRLRRLLYAICRLLKFPDCKEHIHAHM